MPEISNLDFRNQEPPNSQSQNILDSQADNALRRNILETEAQADKHDNQDEVSKLNTISEGQTMKSMLNTQHIGVDP